MSMTTYSFSIGNLKCIAVSDGTFSYQPPIFPPPAAFLFINAPENVLEQALRVHNLSPGDWAGWASPYTCLLIKTGKHQVLVDTGAGDLGPNTGNLLQNLKAGGISPEDIDAVILTHGHPDHIGGNTDANGITAFPNARFVMWKDEWHFWISEQAESTLDEHVRDVLIGIARKNLSPIQGRIDLVDRETEILPYIHAVPAPGHTPGHMALSVSSRDDKLLVLSDTVLHPVHMEHPEWYAAVDISPDKVIATRRRLLKKAADEKALVFAFHFPFPGLGHVIRKDKGWRWQPIELTG